jgi:hypothetical protein
MRWSDKTLRERDICRHPVADALATLLILLVVSSSAALAAPSGDAAAKRIRRRVFDPLALKPVWVSEASRRMDPMVIEIMYQRLLANGGYPSCSLIDVPARPKPRSPFMPPAQILPGTLPPWIQLAKP